MVITGTIKSHRNIRNGSVRDIYHRNIYNVACKGNVSSVTPEFNKIAFKRWYAMIERCYNESAIGYNAYGSNGVSVSDRWLIFENFIKDIVEEYSPDDYHKLICNVLGIGYYDNEGFKEKIKGFIDKLNKNSYGIKYDKN